MWKVERKAEENDYILSADAYKSGIGGGSEDHRDPKEILREIEAIESDLQSQKNKIKKLIL